MNQNNNTAPVNANAGGQGNDAPRCAQPAPLTLAQHVALKWIARYAPANVNGGAVRR